MGWALLSSLFFPVLARMHWPKSKQVPKREVNSSCWASGRSHAGHKLAVSVCLTDHLSLTSLKFGISPFKQKFDPYCSIANDIACGCELKQHVSVWAHGFMSIFGNMQNILKQRPQKSEAGKFWLMRYGNTVIYCALDFEQRVLSHVSCAVDA